MNRELLAIGALVLAAAGCNRDALPVYTAADAAAIDSVRMAWMNAYNAGDADALAALYDESAVRHVANVPSVSGRAAIRAQLAIELADSTVRPRMMIDPATRTDGFSAIATVFGTFRVAPTGDTAMTMPGKYLVVLKHYREGGWLIAYDAASLDAPPPAAPPPPPARR